MKVEELSKHGISEEYIQKFKEEKILELYAHQADIINKGLFKDKNLVISLPTAGGKTLIATISMIDKLTKTHGKIIYLVPLVSLANEKYDYFKNFFGEKYKVAISVGDFDSTDPWLKDYDIIIASNEKMDSLLRHNVPWASQISLIICDEIHLLNDTSRGPTLEILITKLRELVPKAQILALSATIKNADELTKWLNGTLVLSDFRPVKLYQGIAYNSKISFPHEPRRAYELKDEELEEAILENTLSLQKQCLFFVSTRKNAESLSERLCKIVKFNLKKQEHFQLEVLSNEIESSLETPTKQCKKLAKCVQNGVAFHHAGLVGKQKRLIENNFKNGLIKAIIATPTLSYGVNLPATRCIIRDAKRYYPGIGAMYIPVLEYFQMVGRAGRPTWDSWGESILLAKSEEDAQDLTDHFICGEPENITSKLAVEPVLRMHTLALIATEFCKSEKSLLEFFSKTFYAFHYGDMYLVEEKILDTLDQLEEWKFILRKQGKLIPTRIGKRISELYIDPLTAHVFIEALSVAAKRKEIEAFSFLQLISNTIEMRPLLSVRSGEFSEIQQLLIEKEKLILQNIPEEYDLEFEDFFKSIKTSLMFEDWTNESTEDQILTKFRVAPGELRGKLSLADWLVYSLQELSLLLGYKDILKEIRKSRIRLQYGIKEELISLVRLRDVGRIRSRILYRAGLTSIQKLREIPYDRLSMIIGPKVAKSIKDQLEGKKEIKKEEKQITLKRF
jgi:helicase